MKLDKRNPVVRLFIPQYKELTLFLMSITFVLLFVTHSDLRAGSGEILFDKFDLRNYIALVLFVFGILFSLYHVFTTRSKTYGEKIVMLFFAVMVNAFSGIAAGIHILETTHGFLMILPIWNIVNAILLILMYRFDIVDESCIDDDDATPFHVVLGAIVVVGTFVVCRYVFKMYWAITFSICIGYSSNINRTVQGIFSELNKYKKHNKNIEIDLK